MAQGRYRNPARRCRDDRRARPHDAAGGLPAGRLRHGRRRQVAPRPGAGGRAGLERRDQARPERRRVRLRVHHGRDRRPCAVRLRREPPRGRPRSGRPDPRRLSPQDRRLADRKREPRPAEAAPQPRPRHDDRQRHQPHRLDDRRQGRALEGRGHGRRVRPEGRRLHRAATRPAVLPVLRDARHARAADAAPALRRQEPHGAARRRHRAGRLVRRRGRRCSRPAAAGGEHARHPHERQRAGGGRRLPGRRGREARKPQARRAVARRQVQQLRRRHARAVHRALARARGARDVRCARLAGGSPGLVRGVRRAEALTRRCPRQRRT